MALGENALVAHDHDYAVGQALLVLQSKLAAALPILQGSNNPDSYARQKALSDALAPVSQAVIDAMNSYLEAGSNSP